MRVAVFVDGGNYIGLMKTIGWKIDLDKFLKYLVQEDTLVDAFYFMSVASNTKPGIMTMLAKKGFSVITKPAKETPNPSFPNGKKILKANMDVEFATTVVLTMDHYDKAILVTGDGDFVCLLTILMNSGKMFEVVSTEKLINKELRCVAGMHYTDIGALQETLCYNEGGAAEDEIAFFETSEEFEEWIEDTELPPIGADDNA